MNSIIANALFSLYYDGFIDSFFNTLSGVLGAVNEVLSQNFIATCFNTMSGIAASLIIIYFYIDIVDLVTRELFSLEKLISLFIRMFVCVAVCACMQQLCTVLVGLTDQFLKFVNGTFKEAIEQSRIVMLIPENEDDFVVAMNNIFTGGAINAEAKFIGKLGNLVSQISFTLSHPLWSIEAFIIIILSGIIKIVGYFIAISTSIMLIVRFIFAPIGIVNMFRGDTSSGMRYFKSLIATACSFGAMLAIVGAATLITAPLMESGVFKTLGLEGDDENDDSLEDDDENDDASDDGILLTIDFGYVDGVGIYHYADGVEERAFDELGWVDGDNLVLNDYYDSGTDLNLSVGEYDTIKEVIGNYAENEDAFLEEYHDTLKEIWENKDNWETIVSYAKSLGCYEESIWDGTADKNNPNLADFDGVRDFTNFDYALAVDNHGNIYRIIQNYLEDYVQPENSSDVPKTVDGEDVKYLSGLDPTDESLYQLKLEDIYSSQIDIALNFRTVIAALVPQLAAIGGMAGATRIIRDALGV